MQTLGPYLLNPYAPPGNGISSSLLSIPMLAGQNSLIELINLSPYILQCQFSSKGQVFQEGRSKAIYHGVPGLQGTQTVNVNVLQQFATQFVPASQVGQPTASRGYTYLWINVYQEGEIEWYPPCSLNPFDNQEISNFCSQTTAAGGSISLLVPNLNTRYGVLPPINTSFITGFDFTANQSPTSRATTLVISNLITQDDGSNSITYQLWNASTNGQQNALSIRFPNPLQGDPATLNQITFTSGSLNTATLSLVVYYFLH